MTSVQELCPWTPWGLPPPDHLHMLPFTMFPNGRTQTDSTRSVLLFSKSLGPLLRMRPAAE